MNQPISSAAPANQRSAALIYVVDDEPMVGELIETVLKLQGYHIQRFLDPSHAFDSFLKGPKKPDLLLTDFFMPEINGMELIQIFKKECPRLKTILSSGNADETTFHNYLVKPDRFLRKPFFPRALLDEVKMLLSA